MSAMKRRLTFRRLFPVRSLLCATVVWVVLSVAREARAEVVPPATDLPKMLALDEALRIFRTRGLDLLIAEANTRSAEGDVTLSAAVPNPGVSLSSGYAWTYRKDEPTQSCLTSGVYCSPFVYNIGVTDNNAIEDSVTGKRDLRQKVFRNALAAAKLARVDAQRNLEFQVKSAYAQVAQAALGFVFAKKVADSNVVTLEKFRVKLSVGQINPGDYARIRTQKLEADQALSVAVQNLRQSRIALAFLIGVRGLIPDFDVDTKVLDFAPPPSLQNATEATMLHSAFSHRPDLVGAGYQLAAASSQIDLVNRQRFPDIALTLGYQGGGYGGAGTNGPVGQQIISVGISGNLPVFYGLEGERRKAAAQYDANALQQAKLTALVASDVANAFVAEQTARELVKRMEGPDGLLESAKQAYDTIALQYDKGLASVTDYLDAYRTYVATQVEEFQDLTNYWTALFQLEQAVGMELRR
jgi:cobalt-zinc-cadmium efflux system outer membrane protein